MIIRFVIFLFLLLMNGSQYAWAFDWATSEEALNAINELTKDTLKSPLATRNDLKEEKRDYIFDHEMEIFSNNLFLNPIFANKIGNDCVYRQMYGAKLLLKHFKIKTKRIILFPGKEREWLSYRAKNGKSFKWSFHVALVIDVKDRNEKVCSMVFDPFVSDNAISIDAWLAEVLGEEQSFKATYFEEIINEGANNGFLYTLQPAFFPSCDKTGAQEFYKKGSSWSKYEALPALCTVRLNAHLISAIIKSLKSRNLLTKKEEKSLYNDLLDMRNQLIIKHKSLPFSYWSDDLETEFNNIKVTLGR